MDTNGKGQITIYLRVTVTLRNPLASLHTKCAPPKRTSSSHGCKQDKVVKQENAAVLLLLGPTLQ